MALRRLLASFEAPLILLTLPVLLLGAVVADRVVRQAFAGSSADLRQVEMEGERVASLMKEQTFFHAVVLGVVQGVEEGGLSLKKGTETLIMSAKRFNPQYLRDVDRWEQGKTCKERVARNILRSFQMSDEPPDQARQALLERLHQELQEICAEAQHDE